MTSTNRCDGIEWRGRGGLSGSVRNYMSDASFSPNANYWSILGSTSMFLFSFSAPRILVYHKFFICPMDGRPDQAFCGRDISALSAAEHPDQSTALFGIITPTNDAFDFIQYLATYRDHGKVGIGKGKGKGSLDGLCM